MCCEWKLHPGTWRLGIKKINVKYLISNFYMIIVWNNIILDILLNNFICFFLIFFSTRLLENFKLHMWLVLHFYWTVLVQVMKILNMPITWINLYLKHFFLLSDLASEELRSHHTILTTSKKLNKLKNQPVLAPSLERHTGWQNHNLTRAETSTETSA